MDEAEPTNQVQRMALFAAGGVALLAMLLAYRTVTSTLVGAALLDIGLALGAFGLLLLLADRHPIAPWLGAGAVWLIVGNFARRYVHTPELAWTTVLPIAGLVLVVGAAFLRVPPRVVVVAGVLAAAGLLAALASSASDGALQVLALGGTVATLLLLGVWLLGRKPERARLAAPIVLWGLASQLYDGAITYFAVVDPFNLLQSQLHEMVFLSDLLLRTTGPGFLLLKGALGLFMGLLLEKSLNLHGPKRAQHLAFAWIVLGLGLGPAIFSTSNLLVNG